MGVWAEGPQRVVRLRSPRPSTVSSSPSTYSHSLSRWPPFSKRDTQLAALRVRMPNGLCFPGGFPGGREPVWGEVEICPPASSGHASIPPFATDKNPYSVLSSKDCREGWNNGTGRLAWERSAAGHPWQTLGPALPLGRDLPQSKAGVNTGVNRKSRWGENYPQGRKDKDLPKSRTAVASWYCMGPRRLLSTGRHPESRLPGKEKQLSCSRSPSPHRSRLPGVSS